MKFFGVALEQRDRVLERAHARLREPDAGRRPPLAARVIEWHDRLSGAAAAESGPGKIVLAFVKAASAKDYAALKPLLSDELIKEFESREGALALQMVYALMPADITITSVTEMGDAAVVKAASPESKSPMTFRTVRVNGVWKMAKK